MDKKAILCFGEILLRLSPPNHAKLVQTTQFDAHYGGSEANVAVSLAQLGAAARYVTRVPDSPLGHAALGALRQFGVDTTPSVWGGERLGLYFLEIGQGRRGSRVIYDRSASGMATLSTGTIDWAKALEGVSWLHWSGITPALSADAAQATLEALRVASDMGVHISCDLNYRANLWQYGKTPADVMPALIEHCDVLMGDATAFDLFFGIQAEDTEGLLRNVAAHFPKLKHVAMTAREGFSASHNAYKGYLYDGNAVFASQNYDMPDIIDRIGGGDAFMAGLIFGLIQPEAAPQYVVDFAAAAAVLKHYVAGDFNVSTLAEVHALMSGQTGGRVSR